jgi:DNA gyrase subunit A
MAGINLSAGAEVITFFVTDPKASVVTVAGSTSALPGTDNGTCKVSDLAEFPTKGRATGGVRAHTFRKGEDTLLFAAVASGPLRATSATGVAVDLPTELSKRDATGTPISGPIHAVAGGEK